MPELMPLLKELIRAPGLSGHEQPVRKIIAEAWQPLVDEISTSRLGSLHALKRGSGPEPRPSLLIATHMDAIGLMVTGVKGEFLSLSEVGGVDARVLPGQLVIVHGRKDLPGVIAQPPAHLLPPDNNNGPVHLENLLVDTGLEAGELIKLVRPGDLVSFAQEPIELRNDTLAGHTLDNRASVAALTACLEELSGRRASWDVWAVATVQEEETLGGAATSAFQLHPSLAVAVDVTFGTGPGTSSNKAFDMGKGIVLCMGPNIHPGLFKAFKELAEKLEIPYKIEVTGASSGTDAYAMQVAAEGFPTMVLSIPLRYMHTPVEMVSMKDISRAGRLLAAFAASLDDQFMEKLKLD
jgi:endoglucanase